MMNFELTDDQISIRNMVRAFCVSIAPHVMEFDNSKTFPQTFDERNGRTPAFGAFLSRTIRRFGEWVTSNTR